MKIIYNIFKIPALILHELSHLVMMFLTLNILYLKKIEISKNKNFTYDVLIKSSKPRFFIIEIIISMSPFLNFLITIILMINNIHFIFLLLYLLLTLKISIPSKRDFNNIKDFNKPIDPEEDLNNYLNSIS